MFHLVFEFIDFVDPVANATPVNVLNSSYDFNAETSWASPLILQEGELYAVCRFNPSFNDSFSISNVEYLLSRRELAVGLKASISAGCGLLGLCLITMID
jgi:hypothetical protein